MSIKNFFAACIQLRPSQIEGFRWLYLIVITLFLMSILFRNWLLSDKLPVFTKVELKNHSENPYQNQVDVHKIIPSVEFFFNPNIISDDSLKLLGLPAKVIKNLLRYRSSGGRFKQASDIQKIYGMTTDMYNRLLPWIRIPDFTTKSKATYTHLNDHRLCQLEANLRLDINLATADSLKQLCLSQSLIHQWVQYRSKVGFFTKKSDLLKLYLMDSIIYDKIKDHVFVSDVNLKKKKKTIQTFDRAKPVIEKTIDINESNLDAWIDLPGIGFTKAKRIIQFRNALGGFHQVDQLLDVIGIMDSIYINILPRLTVAVAPNLQKIDLNDASEEELTAHPYIHWYQAKEILLFRDEFGKFTSLNELSILETFQQNKSHLIKLKPYLTVQ